jgi:hypothetical protein
MPNPWQLDYDCPNRGIDTRKMKTAPPVAVKLIVLAMPISPMVCKTTLKMLGQTVKGTPSPTNNK